MLFIQLYKQLYYKQLYKQPSIQLYKKSCVSFLWKTPSRKLMHGTTFTKLKRLEPIDEFIYTHSDSTATQAN